MKRLILIDGNSLMYRAYYGMASMGTLTQNSFGQYTNAIYAFTRMINNILKTDYDSILVAFDAGKKTFRHDIMPEYKAGRTAMPDELRSQIPYIKEYLEIMSISQYQQDLYEADDIIGTMATEAVKDGFTVDIYSSDRDLLQLIDENITVNLTKKGLSDLEIYNPESFFEKYQITHKQYIDLKALMGDKSDNISGVPGVGEKTGVKLLQEYKSIEGIIENASNIKGAIGEKIRENSTLALKCKEMVTIVRDAPIKISVSQIKRREPNKERQRAFYQFMEFHSLMKEIALEKKTEIKEEYQIISEQEELKKILVPYSAIVFETFENDYFYAPICAIAIKNHLGTFIIDTKLLYQSLDLKLFLMDEGNHKSVFNYKRMIILLNNIGLDIKGVDFDLLLASYILNPSIPSDEFKAIANFHKYNDIYYEEEIYGKGAKRSLPDINIVYAHASLKAKAIFVLRKNILARLEEEKRISLLADIELPLSRVLAKMEKNGIAIDINELNIQRDEIEDKITDLEQTIHTLAGKEFNIASPKQLGVILFEDLGIKYPKTFKGTYQTDIEILEQIVFEHQIVPYIIEYRQASKLRSGFLAPLDSQMHADGRIHTIFQQTLTQTGRLSSVEPNLQNIPIRTKEGHRIRKIFVPTRKENLLFGADYSQIELRVFAHMAKVTKLIESFNNNEDIHIKTAKEIFGKESPTADDRRKAKAVNFGIIYGISAYGLHNDTGLSIVQAKSFMEKYHKAYPEIKKFTDTVIEFVTEKGYIRTMKNRIRYIPEIKSKIYKEREFGRRIAINTPIQGTAADIIKIAMINIDREITSRNLKSIMLLQVHDELVFEVYLDEQKVIEELVTRNMQEAMKLCVPLVVESSFGNSWYEVK